MYESSLHESFLKYLVGKNRFNELSCQRQLFTYEYDAFQEAIEQDMHYKLYLDELPAAVVIRDPVNGDVHKDYNEGIPVGKLIVDQTDI